MGVNEVTKGGKDYIGYDYKTVTTDSAYASLYLDCYESLGWMPDDSMSAEQFGDTAVLKLKRDRKILNKVELTRLQNHFESCADEIRKLERSKTETGLIASLAVGLLGTACMAGSVFAVTHEPPIIILCVLLGVPGFAGWISAYFCGKAVTKKKTVKMNRLIEQKYNEIHEICEKGSRLL